MIIEDSLDDLKLTGIVSKNGVIFGSEVVLKGVSLDGVFELLEEINGLLNALRLAEVVINELLELSIQL